MSRHRNPGDSYQVSVGEGSPTPGAEPETRPGSVVISRERIEALDDERNLEREERHKRTAERIASGWYIRDARGNLQRGNARARLMRYWPWPGARQWVSGRTGKDRKRGTRP